MVNTAKGLLYRDTPLILSVEGVTKSFDGFKAIDDLSFYLEEGELRTVIGPNGAGKSTFMDILTGKTNPDEGTVTFHLPDGHEACQLILVKQQCGLAHSSSRP